MKVIIKFQPNRIYNESVSQVSPCSLLYQAYFVPVNKLWRRITCVDKRSFMVPFIDFAFTFDRCLIIIDWQWSELFYPGENMPLFSQVLTSISSSHGITNSNQMFARLPTIRQLIVMDESSGWRHPSNALRHANISSKRTISIKG